MEDRVDYAHITNTGRLHELLVEGRRCIATPIRGRKLHYRLVGVEHRSGLYAVIDTLTQMKALEKAIEKGLIPELKGCRIRARNPRIGGSTLDYILECNGQKLAVEVKSAVLEGPQGEAMYPDCPTDRGVRHVRELARLTGSVSMRPLIIMVAAFPGARCFKPYREGDPRLYNELTKAVKSGVQLLAIGLYMDREGAVYLENPGIELCRDWVEASR